MRSALNHKPIMVLGTSSGSGKSLITAAICRVLSRKGGFPLPFKGQNMSNNAWVDESGGEMAYSQAFQAWASQMEPLCCMNPVLLKPRGDTTSEVIHLGKSVGIARAESYYEEWFRSGWLAIKKGLSDLSALNEDGTFVLEGAGSPVEVNLQKRDLTNIRLAQYLQANTLLVADIERGGVFAQIVGTLKLLRPIERSLIKGILINRFRGRRELFEEGRIWLERNTGIPVVGILPWLDELFPPEDSLDLLSRNQKKTNSDLEIVIIRLPSISNFSDFDPLEAEPTVNVRWVKPGESFGLPDVVILPGSKQTVSDLLLLKKTNISTQLNEYHMNGGCIFGICGGYQMLGTTLLDPFTLEGSENEKTYAGLGLIPISTTFNDKKKLTRRTVVSLWPKNAQVTGFELHHGKSVLDNSRMNCNPVFDDRSLGMINDHNEGGYVGGTYLHGIFDNGNWRRIWLNQLRSRKSLSALETNIDNFTYHRDILLNRLADSFERYINLDTLVE